MLGCPSTVLEKLALMGKTGKISAPRASGTGGSDRTDGASVVPPFVKLRRAPMSVESNQSKVLSVMETWHCVELYLSVQNTARAAEKGRTHRGVEGTVPWHRCGAAFWRGGARNPQILFQQSPSKAIHNPCSIHVLLQLCCQQVLGGGSHADVPCGFAEELDVWFPPPVPAAPGTELLFSVLPTITEMSFLQDKSVIVVGSFLWCLFKQKLETSFITRVLLLPSRGTLQHHGPTASPSSKKLHSFIFSPSTGCCDQTCWDETGGAGSGVIPALHCFILLDSALIGFSPTQIYSFGQSHHQLLNPLKIALTFWDLLMCRLILGVCFGNTEFAQKSQILNPTGSSPHLFPVKLHLILLRWADLACCILKNTLGCAGTAAQSANHHSQQH